MQNLQSVPPLVPQSMPIPDTGRLELPQLSIIFRNGPSKLADPLATSKFPPTSVVDPPMNMKGIGLWQDIKRLT
jgi:hypothetical protein